MTRTVRVYRFLDGNQGCRKLITMRKLECHELTIKSPWRPGYCCSPIMMDQTFFIVHLDGVDFVLEESGEINLSSNYLLENEKDPNADFINNICRKVDLRLGWKESDICREILSGALKDKKLS